MDYWTAFGIWNLDQVFPRISEIGQRHYNQCPKEMRRQKVKIGSCIDRSTASLANRTGLLLDEENSNETWFSPPELRRDENHSFILSGLATTSDRCQVLIAPMDSMKKCLVEFHKPMLDQDHPRRGWTENYDRLLWALAFSDIPFGELCTYTYEGKMLSNLSSNPGA